MVKKRGKFIVIDGLDGVGKGVFLKTFVKCAEEDRDYYLGKHIFAAHTEVKEIT